MSKYTGWLNRLDRAALRRELDEYHNLAEAGERRIMNLELQAEPDTQEIAANKVLLRYVLAHIKSIEMRLAACK